MVSIHFLNNVKMLYTLYIIMYYRLQKEIFHGFFQWFAALLFNF